MQGGIFFFLHQPGVEDEMNSEGMVEVFFHICLFLLSCKCVFAPMHGIPKVSLSFAFEKSTFAHPYVSVAQWATIAFLRFTKNYPPLQ